jgi:tetratricopeptide (TPR) repeat protein
MLRKLIAVAAVMTTLSCADPGAVTSPDAAAPLAANASLARCTADQGQQFIDAGEYDKAIREFSCVIDRDPTGVEGYRGRIEAQLMLGLFSDAVRDYTRVMAFVEPVHPDAAQVILAGYAARLAAAPDAVTALTGKSFAHWWFFDYPAAMHVADKLLAAQPNDVYGTLFRGSSRVLQGTKRAEGAADLERAITLAPSSPHVRFIVADAYTYGSLRDPQRAFTEASFALDRGLDTPRIRAILGASHNAFGDLLAAAAQIKIHLELVTTELVTTSPLAAGSSANLAVVPARTYDIPVAVAAGETLSIATSSKDFWDTILVLLAPDGSPVVGSDDYKGYFAGLDWVAPAAGTYRLRVTSFEAVSTGELLVARK